MTGVIFTVKNLLQLHTMEN